MEKTPSARGDKISDQELRFELEAARKPKEIAEKYGLSVQAVYKRINRLGLTTAAAAVAPVESQRYVGRQLDAIEELLFSLHRVKRLYDAIEEWLKDPVNPEVYDIGPRSTEVMVTYLDFGDDTDSEGARKDTRKKAPLQELLNRLESTDGDRLPAVLSVERAEFKHADPRTLMLSTAQELRQTISTAADLAKMIADTRAMELLKQAILDELRKESPEFARKIAEAVRRSVLLHQSLGGPLAVAAGSAAAGAV